MRGILIMNKRTVFFLSDRTGITVEMLGHSLLTQFEGFEFEQTMLPFIETKQKALRAVEKINKAAINDGARPILFCTLISDDIREIIATSHGLMFDFFETFINPLEQELESHSTHAIGRSHGIGGYSNYKTRIDAVNFALGNDDGTTLNNYPEADVILIGVSRSGKTPTCLYLALQYGIYAANYPITEDDLDEPGLPRSLRPFKGKLFGLTISPERLHNIRNERMRDSRYSSIGQCQYEVRAVEGMYRGEHVPFLDTSAVSIEEIATTVLHKTKLTRRLYG